MYKSYIGVVGNYYVYNNHFARSYEISKQITSQWENGYVATITIRNTGNPVINNWALYFTIENEIENVWNGNIDSFDGFSYTVTNAGWNENIQPNSSVSF